MRDLFVNSRFSNLLTGKSFTYKRSILGAILFYLMFSLFAIVVVVIFGVYTRGQSTPFISNTISVLIYTAIMIYLVINFMKKKNLFKSKKYLMLGIIAILLSLLQGFLIGLVIPAYFSTLEKEKI